MIKDCIAADQPVMLWGAPGIGKTRIMQLIARKLDRDLFTILAHLKEAPDFSGYLVMNRCEAGQPPVMTAPADLPATDHDTPSILFVDEINGTQRDTQGALYQLIQDGRLNSYYLPKDCARVAAGNRTGDRGVTNAMPTPLKNRFVHLELTPDRAQWLTDFAAPFGIHPLIQAYHNWRKADGYLMCFDPKSDEPAFASPRSWEALSRLMHINPAPALQLIAGTVGTGVGTDFSGFVKTAAQLPQTEMIYFDPDHAPVPTEPSALFAVTGNLAASIDVTHFDPFVRYIDRLPDEYSVLAMDLAKSRLGGGIIMHLPAFTKWAQKHAYLF